METHLQDDFQFVNGNFFERVILMKWLSRYLLLSKHVRLLEFFLIFVQYFTSFYAVDSQKEQDKKGHKTPFILP